MNDQIGTEKTSEQSDKSELSCQVDENVRSSNLDVDMAISIAKEVVALYKKHNLSFIQYLKVSSMAGDIFNLDN